MQQITLRLPEDVLEDVEAEAEEAGRTRSEYLREVIRTRNEHTEEAEQLREQVDELQTEVERLQNEKRTILEQREEKQELAQYVERERTINEQWRQAGIITRTKWKLLGMPESEA